MFLQLLDLIRHTWVAGVPEHPYQLVEIEILIIVLLIGNKALLLRHHAPNQRYQKGVVNHITVLFLLHQILRLVTLKPRIRLVKRSHITPQNPAKIPINVKSRYLWYEIVPKHSRNEYNVLYDLLWFAF